MTAASVQGTHAVAHVRSIEAATSLYRAVPRRNSNGLTMLWHDHMWCVLRTGALLDEYEFTTIVVLAPLTIECLAQFGHDARQRICEIFILAFAKAITRHLDATAE